MHFQQKIGIEQNYLDDFAKRVDTENVKIQVLGDISQLSTGLQNSIKKAVKRTENNTGIVFNVAFNYGGRQELVMATKEIAKLVKNGELDINNITEDTISNNLYTKGQPDPDIVIRTSGQIRTSGFLPWQSIYAEYIFMERNWPDFTNESLLEAIKEYQHRTIKKGK